MLGPGVGFGPCLGVLSSLLRLCLHRRTWLGKGQPYRAGEALRFLWSQGTLRSSIQTWVWMEQG